MQQTQKPWRQEFNERFRRDDGLINKYCHNDEGNTVATPDAVESFIALVESRTRADALREAAGVARKGKPEKCCAECEQIGWTLEDTALSIEALNNK